MDFVVIIPARYASKRLKCKLLADIAGKPMLQHVYERCLESGAKRVAIATDSKQIAKVAAHFDATVFMTGEHPSGTERVSEAAVAMNCEDDDIIVNVQGDEPLVPSDVIYQVARDLDQYQSAKVATLCQPIEKIETLLDPHVVKVVRNRRDFALYFSRAPIAWEREHFGTFPNEKVAMTGRHYAHIGIYAYRASFLQEYVSWEACELEEMEYLEQIRVLWNGSRIHVSEATSPVPKGVDTEQDLERVRKIASKYR